MVHSRIDSTAHSIPEQIGALYMHNPGDKYPTRAGFEPCASSHNRTECAIGAGHCRRVEYTPLPTPHLIVETHHSLRIWVWR